MTKANEVLELFETEYNMDNIDKKSKAEKIKKGDFIVRGSVKSKVIVVTPGDEGPIFTLIAGDHIEFGTNKVVEKGKEFVWGPKGATLTMDAYNKGKKQSDFM